MAGEFRDIQGHWAAACIQQLASRGIVAGYPDRSFRPDNPLTRAEFAVLLQKAFPGVGRSRPGRNFADVPSHHWAAGAIANAVEAGFMSGYPEGQFKPNRQIVRVEVFVAIASGLQYLASHSATVTVNRTFIDAAQIPEYGVRAIAAATENEIVVNYPNVRQLHPKRAASRAEVTAILCQAIADGSGGSPVPSAYVARVRSQEIRGVWLTNIDSEAMFSRDRLKFALERLANLHFNTVYPNVWSWGYTLYPSRLAERVVGFPHHPAPWLQGRDLLAEMVEEGHRVGLTIVPWFEYGFMMPPDSVLARRHPEWIARRRDGSDRVIESGVERLWLNPWHPQVQEFIQGLILEIVGDYAVDGIQFDDHFSIPVDLGYDEYTVQLYRQEHLGLAPPDNPNDNNWIRWRSHKLTEFIRQIYKAIKGRRQSAIVSLSPNYQDFAYKFYLQDWRTWQRYGFVEELILQVYRDEIDSFTAELQRSEVQLAQRNIPVGVGILAGLRTRGVPIEQIQTQVQVARNLGFSGVSFFFYESLWNFAPESPADRAVVLKKLFPSKLSRPELGTGWEPSV
jgi:uncharacterized lipoprotein YddW (UPF0748 family)